MEKKPKKAPGAWKQYPLLLVFLLIGGVCGVLMVGRIEELSRAGKTPEEVALFVAAAFVSLYAVCFLQVILHEAGHLLFGLLTGYRFSSFRVGSLMWIRRDGRIRLRRFSLAGTGGQCLMIPPEEKGGDFPYVLYNLGGALVNLIVAGVFAALSFWCRHTELLFLLCMEMAVIGAAYGLINGIPLRLGAVDNDGYNALSLGKSREARRAFWLQLKINEQIARGVRLRDMPDEWFETPEAEAMKNSLVAAMGVFACNRMMDAMEFARADQAMEKLMEQDTGLVGLYRNLMTMDRIYCELVGENRPEQREQLMDKRLKKGMKSVKSANNNPSVLRTQYAYALLAEGDAEKAGRIQTAFDAVAGRYPHPGEIEGERELMAYAAERARGLQGKDTL